MLYRQLTWLVAVFCLWFIISPLWHLGVIMLLCFVGWFAYPQELKNLSYATCFALMLFGHVSVYEGIQICISHPVILLVVGCLISQLIVKTEIHLLISGLIMQCFKPRRELTLALVLFASAGFLSMWISNTSAVAMLIPVVLQLTLELGLSVDLLLLAIAYGSTIGGMLTPIGTPANLIAISYMDRYFDVYTSFLGWFTSVAPFALLLTICMFVYVYCVADRRVFPVVEEPVSVLKEQKQIMLGLFLCILLWATQTVWSQWLGTRIGEEWIGMAFLISCHWIKYKGIRAFEARDIRNLPLGSIALVVTGIFMAEGLVRYQVVDMFIQGLESAGGFYNYQVLLFFALIVSTLTELCSNAAVTSLALPLSTLVVKVSNLELLSAVLLITLSANSAFMLPTATPPNALVLGTGKMSSTRMIYVGTWMSVCSVFILLFLFL